MFYPQAMHATEPEIYKVCLQHFWHVWSTSLSKYWQRNETKMSYSWPGKLDSDSPIDVFIEGMKWKAWRNSDKAKIRAGETFHRRRRWLPFSSKWQPSKFAQVFEVVTQLKDLISKYKVCSCTYIIVYCLQWHLHILICHPLHKALFLFLYEHQRFLF